jgi:RNA polymerase sigma factor (sigma-70 family)
MDQLLLPYLEAFSDAERQRCLDELIVLRAAPVVRKVLRQKLGFHVDQFGINRHNQDAEDLYQEILAKIIQALVELKSSPKAEIERFPNYVSRTAANFCIDYLRSKSPARRRLKDRVRLLLIYQRDFAFWEDEGEFLCGFAQWQGRRKSPMSRGHDQALAEKLNDVLAERYPAFASTQISLLKIIPELFHLTEGPIEIDSVVNILVVVLRLEDQAVTSIGDTVEGETTSVIEPMTNNPNVDPLDLLRRLWIAIKELSPNQRDAFGLRFHDESGDDLFSLLIATRTATLTEIAQVFGRSEQEIMRLRSLMPMDGASTAAELNTSRGQVHQWRFRAIKRLQKELLASGGNAK